MHIALVHCFECFAAIGGNLCIETKNKNFIRVGIGSINFGEVVTIGIEDTNGFIMTFFPGLPAIFTAVHFATGNTGILETIITVEVII